MSHDNDFMPHHEHHAFDSLADMPAEKLKALDHPGLAIHGFIQKLLMPMDTVEDIAHKVMLSFSTAAVLIALVIYGISPFLDSGTELLIAFLPVVLWCLSVGLVAGVVYFWSGRK